MQKKWGITNIVKAFNFRKRSGMQKHSCSATLKKVMLALDDEMSEEEEKKFLEEINSCSHCLEKFHIEKSFKNYLCNKIKRHTIPANVADQIRSSIRNSIEP